MCWVCAGRAALDGNIVDEPLQLGDILLVVGDWKIIRVLATKRRHFIVLNLAAEAEAVVPAASRHRMRCFVWH